MNNQKSREDVASVIRGMLIVTVMHEWWNPFLRSVPTATTSMLALWVTAMVVSFVVFWVGHLMVLTGAYGIFFDHNEDSAHP